MIPTPWTERIFLQLRLEVYSGTTGLTTVPWELRNLEKAHFENRKKWIPPSEEAASPVAWLDEPKVGLIGLGSMGVPMALNLLKAGVSVTVWNCSPGDIADVEAAGAKVAGSLEELAEESKVLIVMLEMLGEPAAALEVAQQLSEAITPGAIYVDVTTVDASTAQQFVEVVRGADCGEDPEERRTPLFLTGGGCNAVDAVSPMLDVTGKAKPSLGKKKAKPSLGKKKAKPSVGGKKKKESIASVEPDEADEMED